MEKTGEGVPHFHSFLSVGFFLTPGNILLPLATGIQHSKDTSKGLNKRS